MKGEPLFGRRVVTVAAASYLIFTSLSEKSTPSLLLTAILSSDLTFTVGAVHKIIVDDKTRTLEVILSGPKEITESEDANSTPMIETNGVVLVVINEGRIEKTIGGV